MKANSANENKNPVIWIVDDDASIRWVLNESMDEKPYNVVVFNSAIEAVKKLEKTPPTVIISDVLMQGMTGLEFMDLVYDFDKSIPFILMTANADLDTAVKSFQSSAFDYLPKPFEIDDALAIIDRAIRKKFSSKKLKRQIKQKHQPLNIIGSAPAMQEVFRILGRVSKLDVTVLINGETGTGKELVARALYNLSNRSLKPFVAINTAAIPRNLLESELFGHERGSFTGALTQRIGRFEEANGGTLFLDEIGDMPIDMQTRLLRVLNDGSFYRVGGKTPINVDVRVIAATHQNMAEMVGQGKFREDLLYRLNVIRIQVPALRDRKEDIILIIKYYLEQEAKLYSLEQKKLNKEVEHYLTLLPWPGNVRQIRSLCTWLTIMAPDKVVTMEDMPLDLQASDISPITINDGVDWKSLLKSYADDFLNSGKIELHTCLEPEFEKILIQSAMEKTKNRRQKAAKLLGWGRNTLTRKTQDLDF
jgi:two-component system nitrogen regulation response regulator GlnG